MTDALFTRTKPSATEDWRRKALCTQFPTVWADRMWLYEDAADDRRPDMNLRATARTICSECPVKAQCVASAVISGDQYGIRGGLRGRERKLMAELAQKDGIVVYSRTGANKSKRFNDFALWICNHEPAWAEVVRMDRETVRKCKRKKSERIASLLPKKHAKKHAKQTIAAIFEEESPAMTAQEALF